MRTPLGDKVLAILKRHVGEENTISSLDLCRELGLDLCRERVIRDVINSEADLWQDVIVCGIPGKGYFVSQDFEELAKFRDCLLGLWQAAGEKLDAFEARCRRHGIALPNRSRLSKS